jgi:hypothetical protein
MWQAASAQTEIPTSSPQPPRSGAARPAAGRPKRTSGPTRAKVLASGTERESTRGCGEVIELECGITVYPARSEGGRWRAVWYEAGERQQCEAATEGKLTPKLEKVAERLKADAPNMRRPGADLIAHYLDLDRLPVRDRWSRRHADTQRRLCERFAAPVIAAVTCQVIKTEHPEDRQRRADGRGRRPGPPDDLRPRHGGDRRRLPRKSPAGEGALAGLRSEHLRPPRPATEPGR